MDERLKDVVARYVDRVGVENAINSFLFGIDQVVRKLPTDPSLAGSIKFRMAIIEYLYLHDDENIEDAIKLGEKLCS